MANAIRQLTISVLAAFTVMGCHHFSQPTDRKIVVVGKSDALIRGSGDPKTFLNVEMLGPVVQVEAKKHQFCNRIESTKLRHIEVYQGLGERRRDAGGETRQRIVEEGVPCEESPAGGEVVVLTSTGEWNGKRQTYRVELDHLGRANVDLTDTTLWRAAFATPFGDVDCLQSCGQISFTLDADTSYKMIVDRGWVEQERWLRTHRGDPRASDVRASIVAARSMEAAQYEQAAREALRKEAWEDAYRNAIRCHGATDGRCETLSKSAATKLAVETERKVKAQIKRGELLDAVHAAVDCNNLLGGESCRGAVQVVRAEVDRVSPSRFKDLAVVREPSGYQIYFSFVNHAGQYVTPPGTAEVFIQVTSSGYPIQSKPLATLNLKAASYQQVAIGIANRPAVVVSFFKTFREVGDALEIGMTLERWISYSRSNRARIVVKFTDALKREIIGEEYFIP